MPAIMYVYNMHILHTSLFHVHIHSWLTDTLAVAGEARSSRNSKRSSSTRSGGHGGHNRRGRNRAGVNNGGGEHGHGLSRRTGRFRPLRRVTKMVFIVTVVFVVCWTPFHIMKFVAVHHHHRLAELIAQQKAAADTS